MGNNVKEIWRYIDGYEGLYQVSNFGNVRTLKFGKKRILKPSKDKDNYLKVTLCKDGKLKTYKIHRLAAFAFIPKIEGKNHVDHIDGNRQNNNVNNLRWCNQKENNNFDLARKHKSEATKGRIGAWKGKTGALHNSSKAVLCVELNKVFGSVREAERELNINHSSISECCLNKRKSAGGYTWKYIELLHCYN